MSHDYCFTRSRSKSSMVPTGVIHYHNHAGGPDYAEAGIVDVLPANEVGEETTFQDRVTPGYRKRKARGQIIMNCCKMTKKVVTGSGELEFMIGPQYNWGMVRLHGDLAYLIRAATVGSEPWYTVNIGVDSMISSSLAKCREEIYKAPIMSGEILSDMNKTVGMLRRPFGNARDLCKRMTKHRNQRLGKTAASATKASASAWLEYRYGWKPILMDADELIQQASGFRKILDGIRLVARGGGSVNRSDAKEVILPKGSWPSINGLSARGSAFASIDTKVSVGIMYRRKSRTSSVEALRVFGMRPRDVLPTLWEVIPYSFVVDWFVNVGSWLEAISPDLSGVEILASWATTVSEKEAGISSGTLSYTTSADPKPTFTCSVGKSSVKTTTYERTSHPSFGPTPTLVATTLSRLHSIDAAALSAGSILNSLKIFRH